MSALTAEAVEATVRDCLFKEHEDATNRVETEGITRTFGFNPDRLLIHRHAILAMLEQLPDEFLQSKGGGWSFLNACNDRDGHQWTGLHRTMEALFCLGLAIGRVKLLMPRELWTALPGGMPYYLVLDTVDAQGGLHAGTG